MIQCLDFPIKKEYDKSFAGWGELNRQLKELGLDGLDGIWIPTEKDLSFPKEMLIGSHIVTMPDWVDFFEENEPELLRRFGSWKKVTECYGDDTGTKFSLHYLYSLYDAIQSGAQFVSLEVYNVTYEECQSYEWRHDDYAVLDAAAELINMILREAEPTFDFLIENSWWPGFRFTEPEKTEYLLSKIKYPRKGIMLNTSHLMNTNLALRTQEEGVEYICDRIKEHGELAKSILGLRLSQSLSGEWADRLIKTDRAFRQISGLPDFDHAEGIIHYNIGVINQRLPWTTPEVAKIVKAAEPKYLVHSPRIDMNCPDLSSVRQQITELKEGLSLCE